MVHKKTLPVTGLAAALMLTLPLSASAQTTQPTTQDQRQSQTQRQTQTQAQAQSQSRQASSVIAASDLMGMNVVTNADESVGSVEEVIIDLQSGKVLGLSVSSGGFLGMGTRSSLVGPDRVRHNAEKNNLMVNMTRDELRDAPRFEKGNYENLTQSNRERRDDRNDRSYDKNKDWKNTSSKNLAASDLVGMNVENHEGENVGTVDKVFLDLQGGEISGIVVSTGGFLGMGDTKTLISLNELKYDHEKEVLRGNLNRERLREFGNYEEGDTNAMDRVRDRTRHMADDVQGNRDRPTVFDQGNSSAELAITADIRRAIIDNKTLSSKASNITIITQGQRVLLRGEVDSVAERSAIEDIARNRAGSNNVVSEIAIRVR